MNDLSKLKTALFFEKNEVAFDQYVPIDENVLKEINTLYHRKDATMIEKCELFLKCYRVLSHLRFSDIKKQDSLMEYLELFKFHNDLFFAIEKYKKAIWLKGKCYHSITAMIHPCYSEMLDLIEFAQRMTGALGGEKRIMSSANDGTMLGAFMRP